MKNDKKIYAERQFFGSKIALFVTMNGSPGRIDIAEPIIFKEREEGLEISDPFLTLTTTEAQLLMDELWKCGLRPSEGTGSAGSLAATERHLKDMQLIAKGLLVKDGVQL